MGMVVRTNTMALNAYRQLGMNNSAVAKSLEKLSSGFRINRAGDDAAGLAISEKMKAQIKGLETASSNAQDGISLIQTAEGNLGEVHDMLNRMVELATKSANGTYTQTERDALQDEVNALLDEIDRISQSANFNGQNLLDGSLQGGAALEAKNITTSAGTADTPGSFTAAAGVTFGANHTNPDNIKQTQDPKFSIDLAEMKFDAPNTSATAATYTLSLSAGGSNITFYSATAAGTNALTSTNELAVTFAAPGTSPNFAVSATDIASQLNGKTAVIGNDVYTVGNSNGKLTFTYAGQKNGDEWINKTATGGEVQTGTAVPNGDITLSLTNGTADGTLRQDCHITDITDAVKGDVANRAGASLTLTFDMIQKGAIKIGDTTFKFDLTTAPATTPATSGTADAEGNKTITIGLKGLTTAADLAGASTAEQAEILKKVTEQMSHATIQIKDKDGNAVNFKVGRGTDTATIEIEEKPATAGSYGLFTEKQLKEAFQVATSMTPGTKSSTMATLTKTSDGALVNIKEGNTITVDGTTYTFNKDGSGTNGVQIGDTAVDTLKNLKAQLDANYTVTVDETNGSIKIETKNNTATPPAVSYTANTDDVGTLTLQIGDTAQDFNKMSVKISDMSAEGLGLQGLKIDNESNASDAIDLVKTAINTVSTQRAKLGALQNRLEHTINNLDVAAENLSAANSRIRDTDMAKEMMNYTKMNVLVQSAQAMLAQANQQPQSVLQLLQ